MTVERIPGFCALCRSRCGCVSVVEDGRLVAVEPDPVASDRREPVREGPRRARAGLRARSAAPPDAPHAAEGRSRRRLGCGSAGTRRSTGPRRACARSPSATAPRRWPSPLTTPAGTAVSDGFPWINRLVRLFGSPNMRLGRGGVRLAPRLRDGLHLRRRHRHAGLRAHRLPAALGPQPGEHVSRPGDRGRGGEGARRRARRGRPAARRASAAAPISGCACGRARTARWRWPGRRHDRARAGTTGSSSATGPTAPLPGARRHGPVPHRRRSRCGRRGHARYVAWDRRRQRPVIYDPAAGRYTEHVDDPLLVGAVRCATRTGPVDCRPAFERYAALCRDYPPSAVARDHRRARRADRRDRAPALGAPAGGVLPLDRARAAHQRDARPCARCRCSTR